MIRVCIFILSVFLLACATKKIPTKELDQIQAIASVPEVNSQDQAAPLRLNIQQEVNDGKNLSLIGLLSAAAPEEKAINALNSGILKLSLYGDKGKIDSKEVPLINYRNVALPVKFPISYEISIPLQENTSSYQLELEWGLEQARTIQASVSLKSDLVLKDAQVEKRYLCDTQPCDLGYTFFANLQNQGNSLINQAKLGVGYIWLQKNSKPDFSKYQPENEEELLISDLNLKPGDSLPVELELGNRVPDRKDGEYRPMVRIIAVN